MSSATAATADGSVLVAEGRAHEAITTLRRAVQLWGELDAPYDAARARVSLGEALLADGSVRSVSENIGIPVFGALYTKAGAETVNAE